MNRSLLSKEIVPFFLMFALLIAATYAGDLLLHKFNLVWIGRYLGILGTFIILLSFTYSMRKRKLITSGKPSTLLKLHEFLTWLGSLMILVHAGVHFHAIMPWLATIAMLVNVISGLIGKFLLDRSRRHLGEKKKVFAQRGLSEEEIEKALFWDSTTLDTMKKWRAVHFPITLAFTVLGLSHIISALLFWNWR